MGPHNRAVTYIFSTFFPKRPASYTETPLYIQPVKVRSADGLSYFFPDPQRSSWPSFFDIALVTPSIAPPKASPALDVKRCSLSTWQPLGTSVGRRGAVRG